MAYQIRVGCNPDRVIRARGGIVLPREAVDADLYVITIEPGLDLYGVMRPRRLTADDVEGLERTAGAVYAHALEGELVTMVMDKRIPPAVRRNIVARGKAGEGFRPCVLPVDYTGGRGVSISPPDAAALEGTTVDLAVGRYLAECQRHLLRTRRLVARPAYRGFPEGSIAAIEAQRREALELAWGLG